MYIGHHDNPQKTPDSQGNGTRSPFGIQMKVEHNTRKHRNRRAMAEPVQRGWHELRDHDVFCRTIETLQEGGIDEIEEK